MVAGGGGLEAGGGGSGSWIVGWCYNKYCE